MEMDEFHKYIVKFNWSGWIINSYGPIDKGPVRAVFMVNFMPNQYT
jgi:hypothetical protein